MVGRWDARENMKTYSNFIILEKFDPTKDPRFKKLTKNQQQDILDAAKAMSDEGRLKKLVDRAFRIYLPDEPDPEGKSEEEKVHDKVKEIMKSVNSRKFNLSTTKGWSEYRGTLLKKFNTAFPNKVPMKAISKLGTDRPFTFKGKRYKFADAFDEWEFITDVIIANN